MLEAAIQGTDNGEVCWSEHPHEELAGKGNKACFGLLELILNTVKGKLRGFSGVGRGSGVVKKYKEELAFRRKKFCGC